MLLQSQDTIIFHQTLNLVLLMRGFFGESPIAAILWFLVLCPTAPAEGSHSGISWQVTLPSASPQHTPWALPARTGGEAMQVLLVRALVYVARGISGSKQSLSPEGTVQHFHRVKPHRSGFSWERRGSSSCLCHAAAEMSTLLAGGSSTAASSSWMNLKLCCLLLPFYSFLKHRQKKKNCSHRINTCSTLSLGKKKLVASEKQHRKLNSKQEDLSQFFQSLDRATTIYVERGQALFFAFRVGRPYSDTITSHCSPHHTYCSPTPSRTLKRHPEP